jgi:hypothetical protein
MYILSQILGNNSTFNFFTVQLKKIGDSLERQQRRCGLPRLQTFFYRENLLAHEISTFFHSFEYFFALDFLGPGPVVKTLLNLRILKL